MKFGSYEVGTGKVVAAILAAGSITIGAVFFTSYARFAATSAPTGASAKTFIWHDSTTNRLMNNVANAGAKYVVDSGGFTTNYLPKASGVGTLVDSNVKDVTGVITFNTAKSTVDVDADYLAACAALGQ